MASLLEAMATPPLRPTSESKLSFAWLVRLRWAAALALALGVVLAGPALHLNLPETALLATISAGALTNALAQLWARRQLEVPRVAFAIVLAIDAVSLTALLYLSGGSHNPFVAAYLVLVVLAATLLGRRAAFAAALIAALAVFALTAFHVPLEADHTHGPGDPGGHARGEHVVTSDEHPGEHDGASHVLAHAETVWIAFPILAALIVYLVSSALRQRDLQLAALEARRQRAEHLAEIGVIAATAAHELGSPLSTIAVVARDLERAIELGQDISADDARLIHKQVERCRDALEELSEHAQQGQPEASTRTPLGELLDDVTEHLADPSQVRLDVGDDVRSLELGAPRRAMGYVLRGILENAYRASPAGEPVRLAARRESGRCLIEIEDRGEGMSTSELAQAGHAPFSRRRSGESGLGVGLFLSRAVVENVGGELTIEARRPHGTRVALAIPLASEEVRA